jgi:hypothetical protein
VGRRWVEVSVPWVSVTTNDQVSVTTTDQVW